MADTLAEIYRNTLTDSSFDSNGEATIVTTNGSTSHVIKNIQVEETDANIKVNGTLKVNDFDVVGLSANSSGSEIIAPSSTVKVKTSAFPLNYLDYEFAWRSSATNYQTHTIATVNNQTIIDGIYSGTNAIPFSLSQSNDRDVFVTNLGSNNYILMMLHDTNSVSHMYLYDTSGNAITSKTASYEQKWFDGKQYVYHHNGSGTHGIDRIDCYTGSTTRLVNDSMSNGSTYPKMFGYKDEYLWYWTRYDVDNPKVYSFADGTLTDWANNTAQSALDEQDKPWYAIKRSNGTYRLVITKGNSEIKYYDWSKGTVLTSSDTPATLALSGTAETFDQYYYNHAVVGSRLYYINGAYKISYIDFETDTPTKAVVGTNTFSGGYGRDIQQVERTPSTSTINARSGYPTPSLKLRVTGVTST